MSLYPENRRKFDPWKLRETSFKNVFSRDDIFHLSFCRQPHKIVPAKGLNFNELYFLPFFVMKHNNPNQLQCMSDCTIYRKNRSKYCKSDDMYLPRFSVSL